jgi:putative transposase
LLNISRSYCSYKSVIDDDDIITHLQRLSALHSDEGFWKYYDRLRNEGIIVNHKRLFKVYKQLKLSMRPKVKKRLPSRVKVPLAIPEYFNDTWSMDFMSDALSNKTKFRTLNVIDDYNREALFIEVDYSLTSSRVISVLNHLINKGGKPKRIRMDNGPEFIANKMREWSDLNEIEFIYIQPGKPMQNGYIERFNRTYRKHVLDAYIFDSIDEVRMESELFKAEYNNNRPHDSLGGLSPINYKAKMQQINNVA